MRQLLLLFGLACLLFALVQSLPTRPEHRHHHHHRRHLGNSTRRHHRQIPHFPDRNEKTAAYCGKHEFHVICGPEKHCDKSCDNLYSPPNCFHDMSNPKCYSPRCLCLEGYVRSPQGNCIRPNRCPNRYSEPEQGDDNDILIDFKPMRFRHHKIRRVRHRNPKQFW